MYSILFEHHHSGNSELVISCRGVGLFPVSQKLGTNNYTMFSGFSIATLGSTQFNPNKKINASSNPLFFVDLVTMDAGNNR